MRALNTCNAIILAILFFTISGVCAIGVSVTAGNGGSGSVGLSTGYNTGYKTAVEDSAVLSFNGALGVQRQMSIQGGSGDLHEEHETTSSEGAVAGVTVDIDGAENYTYGYSLDPSQTDFAKSVAKSSSAKTATASEVLDVTNAKNISASAFGSSVKGDNAEQSLKITSPSGKASLSGYSNKASADMASAAATQSFGLAQSDGDIEINGIAWVDPATAGSVQGQVSDPTYVADMGLFGAGYGKAISSISSFASSSNAKSEKSASVTGSATSLTGLNFTMTGSATNPEEDNALFDDRISGIKSPDESLNLAYISKYSATVSADAKSSSESQSFGAISAGTISLDEYAMNAQNDYAGHNLFATSWFNGKGVYQPAVVNGYCSAKGDGLKAQKASVAGSISILDASAGSLSLSAFTGHIYGADGDGNQEDYSLGQVYGSMATLNKPSSGQAYKVALSATPKATSVNFGTVRGKGTGYYVYTEAYSNSLDYIASQTAMSKKTGGKVYTGSASTKSGSKADASADIRLVSTY